MYIDIPTFKRCCFCFPLRQGLLTWSYIRLVYNILALVYMGFLFSLVLPGDRNLKPLAILSVLIAASILDVIFGVMFIISAHMKKYKLMKLYYKYCLMMLVLAILSIIGFVIFIVIRIEYAARMSYSNRFFLIEDIVLMYVGPTILLFFHAILFIYMVLLVRSELLKLESNLQCKFVKTPASVDAGDIEKEVEAERAVYNRLTSDPGSVYSTCTISVQN